MAMSDSMSDSMGFPCCVDGPKVLEDPEVAVLRSCATPVLELSGPGKTLRRNPMKRSTVCSACPLGAMPPEPDPHLELTRHQRFLERLASGLVRDPNVAEDLIQEAYVAALERRVLPSSLHAHLQSARPARTNGHGWHFHPARRAQGPRLPLRLRRTGGCALVLRRRRRADGRPWARATRRHRARARATDPSAGSPRRSGRGRSVSRARRARDRAPPVRTHRHQTLRRQALERRHRRWPLGGRLGPRSRCDARAPARRGRGAARAARARARRAERSAVSTEPAQ
ncbi:MAG: hypothetical protein GY711_29015 [bacterium]|nr:hypothetical protein [bacterium]